MKHVTGHTSFPIFLYWLPLAVIATVLSGLVYLAVQQDLRLSANDPQVQMAEDTAAQLANGQPIQSVVPQRKVNIAESLAPYVMVFTADGQLVASSAELDGKPPVYPSSVFTNVRQNGEERLTWQPQPGVRSATVVVPYTGNQSGFVVAGRSLREVENRENLLEQHVGLAWLASLAASLIIVIVIKAITGERKITNRKGRTG